METLTRGRFTSHCSIVDKQRAGILPQGDSCAALRLDGKQRGALSITIRDGAGYLTRLVMLWSCRSTYVQKRCKTSQHSNLPRSLPPNCAKHLLLAPAFCFLTLFFTYAASLPSKNLCLSPRRCPNPIPPQYSFILFNAVTQLLRCAEHISTGYGTTKCFRMEKI